MENIIVALEMGAVKLEIVAGHVGLLHFQGCLRVPSRPPW